MSRPHLVKLMDRGLLAFHMVGSNRRIRMADLLNYIDRNERASAYVSHVLDTREHSIQDVKDNAATLTDEDFASLGITAR
jgi:excisionase family DNA binding protein